jgi:cytochrome c
MRSLALASLIILACALASPASADARRGARLAQEKCGACHNVGKHGASPNLKAPTFRRIAHQWPPEQLQESLAEGIVTGHNDMPEFTFSTRQVDDLVAHLTALRQKR